MNDRLASTVRMYTRGRVVHCDIFGDGELKKRGVVHKIEKKIAVFIEV